MTASTQAFYFRGSATLEQPTLGQQLKDAREAFARRSGGKITQQDVADRLGVAKTTVAKWETDVHVPQHKFLTELEKLYGLPLGALSGHTVAGVAVGQLLREQLAEIDGLDIDEWQKELRAERLLAAHRQEILHEWAQVERERVRAIRIAELNALARTRAGARRGGDGASGAGRGREQRRAPQPPLGSTEPTSGSAEE